MNKILNINLGGLPFVVDDSAYELLQKYTDGLRRVFAQNEGRDEIIADIESRMAELISQNLGTKPIVSMKEVDAAIAGNFGDAVHKLDGLREVIELERAVDVFLFEIPLGEFLHPVFDVFGFEQVGHKCEQWFGGWFWRSSTRALSFKR